MRTVTVKEIQHIDAAAMATAGIPSLVLMENAGQAVAEHVLKSPRNKLVSIFCGSGNNGGDGFVAARYLWESGVEVRIFFIGKENKLRPDAAANYQLLRKLKYPTSRLSKITPNVLKLIKRSDVVIDALFGVGLNRALDKSYQYLIQSINQNAKKILSVDIPSGLDGTTGKIYGVCVKADTTITFTFAKKGFFINDGPKYCGRVIVAKIGIPEKVIKLCLK